ncbi:hypothetical protein [Streptomyces tagetis]|nr:hypothetical protein [Streptomyces sp. RG38]
MAPAVLAGLMVSMTLGAAASSATVPVPVLLGPVTFSMRLSFLLPLIPVCLLVHGQGRGDAAAERTAVRSMPHWDGLSMAALLTTASLIGLVEAVIGGWDMGLAMARNFAGFLGLALLARRFAGPGLATLVIALFPFLCAAFGIGVGGRPTFWAWPLHEPRSLLAAVAAAVLIAAGLVATLGGAPGAVSSPHGRGEMSA